MVIHWRLCSGINTTSNFERLQNGQILNSVMYYLLKSIIGQITPSHAFYLGNEGWQNFLADGATMPGVFLDEPITTNDIIRPPGNIEMAYNIRLLFGNRSQLDYTPEQHRPIIKAEHLAAGQFLLRLNASKDSHNRNNFTRITNIRRSEFQNLFDENLTGVELLFQAVLFDASSICF